MTKNSVKIGIIGLGNIAKQHIDNILKGHVKGAELIALCSRTDDSLATELGLKHFSSYQALIDSKLVDAIIIATPTMSHFEIAKYALQQDMHVMLEKPIALSSYEGELLLGFQTLDYDQLV